MEQIRKFMLPEHTNGLYKNEAISSISLTKEVANKINEIVDALNEIAKEDLKWKQEQDGRNRKAILYMKDNLINTLDEMIGVLKSEGFFEARLEEYVSNIIARVDNLLGTVTEGTTTMDAEVIDMRVGANGELYASAGTSVRSQIEGIYEAINTLNNLIIDSVVRDYLEDISFSPIKNKIIETSGRVVDYTAQSTFYVSDKVLCNAGDVYMISGSSFYNHVIVGFYDKFDNLLKSVTDGNSSTVVMLDDYLIVAPPGASYLRIAYDTRNNTGSIKKLEYLDFTSLDVIAMFNNIGAYLEASASDNVLGDEVPYTTLDNSLLHADYGNVVEYVNDAYKVTDRILVEKGAFYNITASANYGNYVYTLLDANGNVIDGLNSEDVSTAQEFNGVVWIPYNARYIQLAFITTLNTASVRKVVSINASGSRKWSGVTWVAFGDSLTEVNARTNKNYHKYIAEETGINVLNYGVGGSGYARSNENFYTRVSQLANVDFDVITFFGSGNDLGSGLELGTATDNGTTTIAGCINKTLDNLFAIKPFANVGIITPTAWNGSTPDIADNNMMKYADLLIAIAKRRSIPVLDLYRESNLHPESEAFRNEFYFENGVLDNGVHPNSKGHKRIASQIREFIAKLI